jgi:hypothetical protein
MRRVTAIERWWSKVDAGGTGCWLWTGKTDKHGYGYFRTPQRWVGAARWFLLFMGHVDFADAAHRCNNPPCVRPSHLYPASKKQNHADSVANGTAAAPPRNDGDRHWTRRHPERIKAVHTRKFTEQQIEDIRRAYATRTISAAAFEKEHGISHTHLFRVIRTGSGHHQRRQAIQGHQGR